MKQFTFLDNSGELKASIKLDGHFVIAYSLRLWKEDDKVLELVEDIRGSCFNNNCKEVCYTLSKIPDTQFTYFLEVDANISTIHSITNYSIELILDQKLSNGQVQFLGKDKNEGKVGFSGGGNYAKLGLTLHPFVLNKMVG